MGGEPYWYFVKYKPDLDAALQELREREFLAGRYNPVTPFLRFPIDPTVPGPGAGHDSIREVLKGCSLNSGRHDHRQNRAGCRNRREFDNFLTLVIFSFAA